MTSFGWILCKGVHLPFTILCILLYAGRVFAASDNRLLSLDCQDENLGVWGEDSVLKCSLNSRGKDVTIINAWWGRPEEEHTLVMFQKGKFENPADPRFSFRQLEQRGSSIDVSFLVKNTMITDQGNYECQVRTNSGDAKAVVSLSVTASYTKPQMSSVPERGLREDMEVTLFCNASGGYPLGAIYWEDQDGSDCTRSAETTVTEAEDKRFTLSSRFTLGGASSSSPRYRCSVRNGDGVEEGAAQLDLPFPQRGLEPVPEGKNNTIITAVVVIVGALACGVLILFLLRRRRAEQARWPSTHPTLGDRYTMPSRTVEGGSAGLTCQTESASEMA